MRKILFVALGAAIFILALDKLAVACGCSGGCGGGSCHGDSEMCSDTVAPTPSAEAGIKQTTNVGNKICPVMGQKINEQAKATYEYEGKIYNLCCAGCITAFKKDPQKYIQKVNEELKAGY